MTKFRGTQAQLADMIVAMENAELIMRDGCRKAGDKPHSLMHLDRAQAFRQAAALVRTATIVEEAKS